MEPNPYTPPIDPSDATALSSTFKRFALWVLLTPGLTLTLFVMCPTGYSVGYAMMVFATFLVTFALVAIIEQHRSINLAAVAIFWVSCCVFHVTDLGTAPMAQRRLFEGLFWIALLAVAHAAFQLLIHNCMGHNRDHHKPSRTPRTLANKAVNPSGGSGEF